MAAYDGGLPHMPDFSARSTPPSPTKLTHAPFIPSSLSISSPTDLKSHLQTLLDGKEKQLQHAGTLGQRVLAQQMELEERIRQLEERIPHIDVDGSGQDELEVEEGYRALIDTVEAWDRENAQLSSAFGAGTKRFTNGKPPTPLAAYAELPRDESDRTKATTSAAAQSRRAKNAAHRADDVEFAFEIGSGLLTEVRRLQSLLGERDKAIQDMKEEKDDLEKTVEGLRTALRQQEQSADKFKEENWNLEVTLQDTRTQLAATHAQTQKLEAELKRTAALLTSTRDTADAHKTESERLVAQLGALKSKHETEVAQARRTAAALGREKSDLQSALDDALRAGRAKKRFGSPGTPGNHSVGGEGDVEGEFGEWRTPAGENDDVFGHGGTTGGASTRKRGDGVGGLYPPDFELDGGASDGGEGAESPVRRLFRAANHPSNEIEALQQRLAHAQRQVSTLKGSLAREKAARLKMAAAAGIAAYALEGEEGEDEDEVNDEKEKENKEKEDGKRISQRRLTPFKVGSRRGHGRGRGGITLIQRLGMAAGSPASHYGGDADEEEQPPVPPIPSSSAEEKEAEDEVSRFFGAGSSQPPEDDEEYEEEAEINNRNNELQPHSNRTSVDGMDPAFANVLKRVPSTGGIGGSPLRRSVLGRNISARGRGGVPSSYSANRRTTPSSTERRGRGGVPYQARPPSLVVDALDVLATELGTDGESLSGPGLGMGSGLERSPSLRNALAGNTSPMRGESLRALNDVSPLKGMSLADSSFAENIKEEEEDQEKEGDFVLRRRVETAEFGCQTEEEPPIIKVSVEMGVQVEPEPIVVAERVVVETAMQTEEVVEVKVATADAGIQHIPNVVDADVQTIRGEKVDADVQTRAQPPSQIFSTRSVPSTAAAYAAAATSRRTTITQSDISGDATITRSFLENLQGQDEEDEEDGNETETGAETETDTDDYHDARQSINFYTPTPSESQDDFHSVMTAEYPEFASDASDEDDIDDGESIKASRLSSLRDASASRLSNTSERDASPAPSSFEGNLPPSATYETVGVSADLYVPPEPVIVEKERPRPEVKEISIQTEEWTPVPPPASIPAPVPVPISPQLSSPGLYRVGSNTQQQFQFILPSPPPLATAAVAAAGATSSSSPIPTPTSSVFRESSATFARRTSTSDRRVSGESAISNPLGATSSADEGPNRARVGSSGTLFATSPIDKTRPPMMVLPPPPKLPPPPNSMLPPAFIPERRDVPPPRPSSPPPPELIQRATTPTFGAVLAVPGPKGLHQLRQHGSSMPPSQAGLRQPPSTSSFRSAAANAASYIPGSLPSFTVREAERGEFSSIGHTSERSMASPRSSISSEQNLYQQHQQHQQQLQQHQNQQQHQQNNRRVQLSSGVTDTEAETEGDRTADITPRGHAGAQSTDPVIIHAITQTMIGEFLYKYTRRTIGKGPGEKRHRRFFWVHPYTKTLYWSSADPGSSNVSESSAKSAYIEGVRSVLDPNPMPPGLYQYSVVVSTPQREMKITAPTKERHDIWLNALKYLLSRPGNPGVTSPNNMLPAAPGQSPTSMEFTDDERRPRLMSSPQSQRSGRSANLGETWNTTPRGQRSRSQISVNRSVGKRSGTPAVEYLRWNNNLDSPYSPSRSFVDVPGHDEDELDFELHGDSHSDDGFEGLENVRACCDGRHTVGHAGKHHHHHHHHNHNHPHSHSHNNTTTSATSSNSNNNNNGNGNSNMMNLNLGGIGRRQSSDSQHLQPNPLEMARPASPAWSFRSRTGSANSHEGGIFSWGRREDGKLRFGSRRSAKTSVTTDT